MDLARVESGIRELVPDATTQAIMPQVADFFQSALEVLCKTTVTAAQEAIARFASCADVAATQTVRDAMQRLVQEIRASGLGAPSRGHTPRSQTDMTPRSQPSATPRMSPASGFASHAPSLFVRD